MKGTWTERGKGTYFLRVDLGNDPVTGKRRRATKTVHIMGPKPVTQVEAALREFIEEAEGQRGRLAPKVGLTVGEAVEKWFASFHAEVVAGTKSPSTERKYREVIDPYIVARIGKLPLKQLTAEVLDELYEQLLASGRTGHARADGRHGSDAGGPLAPGTIRNIHTVIRNTCMRAAKYRWVSGWTEQANPAVQASPPRVRKRKKTPPSTDQARALMAAAEEIDPDWAAYLRLSAAVGSRRGEVTGLHHSAFGLEELDEATVRIETALAVGLDGVVETEAPKSDTGFRTVALDRATALAVKAVMHRQKERAFACGGRLVADPYLFASDPTGVKPWDPRVVTRKFIYLRTKLGFPKVRLNDLRHYVATQLLGQGVDIITVAEHLGHDPTVTGRVYAEFIPANSRKAAEIMGGLLDGTPKPRRRRSV